MALIALAGVLFVADIAGSVASGSGHEQEKQALLEVRTWRSLGAGHSDIGYAQRKSRKPKENCLKLACYSTSIDP